MKKSEIIFILILLFDAPVFTCPQITKMIYTHSSHDVSIITWIGMSLMACLWTWIAKREKSWKLAMGSALWAICDLIVAIVALMLRF